MILLKVEFKIELANRISFLDFTGKTYSSSPDFVILVDFKFIIELIGNKKMLDIMYSNKLSSFDNFKVQSIYRDLINRLHKVL